MVTGSVDFFQRGGPDSSDAACLGWTTAVVGDGGHVLDGVNVKAESLCCANRCFASRSRTGDSYLDFFQSVAHGLATGILRDDLSCVSRALSAAPEAHLT